MSSKKRDSQKARPSNPAGEKAQEAGGEASERKTSPAAPSAPAESRRLALIRSRHEAMRREIEHIRTALETEEVDD